MNEHQWVLAIYAPLDEETALRIVMGERVIPSEYVVDTARTIGPGCSNCLLDYLEAVGKPCNPTAQGEQA